MATASNAKDTDFRRKWDKEEYAEKAKQKDQEEKERMQENEKRLQQGKRPLKSSSKTDVPKPTELMKHRTDDLQLDKDLGKTMVVQNPGGRGPGQPGFYCEACNRTYKDTTGYLDHINSRAHLRMIGQTTKLERSTVDQVRARIAFLREKTRDASKAKEYDFDQRLQQIRDHESTLREQKKSEKKAQKEAARIERARDAIQDPMNDEMAAIMGFSGGFGSTKK